MRLIRRALVLAFSLAAGAAFACGDAGTIETECPIRPYDGARVPANLPALAFNIFFPVDGGTFELRGPDGGLVPLTIEQQSFPSVWLARLSAPLEVDAGYVASVPCARAPGGVRSIRFETSPAMPLPSSVGTLTAFAPQPNPRVGPPCYSPSFGMQAQLELVPSPELEAFMPVTLLTMKASTMTYPWATVGYGYGFHQYDPQFSNRLDRVYVLCEGSGGGLPEGTTTLELHAAVAGSTESWTPATTTVTLSCDGGTTDGGTTEQLDGGTEPSPSPGGCGCSSGDGALALGMLLITLARKRAR